MKPYKKLKAELLKDPEIKEEYENIEHFSVMVHKDADGYGAVCAKSGLVTNGKTREELWDMIADGMKCAEDVEVSWWNTLLNKLKRYGK